MALVQLYMERTLAAQAEAAEAGAFLIGGYASQPSFGDYLQLKATVHLHEEIGAHQVLYPLLDSRSWVAHAHNKTGFGAGRCRVLPVYYYSGSAAPNEPDDLVPLPRVPPCLLVHVYGGDLIDDRRGQPVRRAANALIERHARENVDGQLRLFMSGQQASAEADAWRPLLAQAEYVGGRDPETVTALKGLLSVGAEKVRYSGDDALPALASALKNGAGAEPALTIAAHVNLAADSCAGAGRRLERIAGAIAAAARRFGAGVTCEVLAAHQAGHPGEQEVVQQLEALYGRLVTTGAAPRLTFRARNLLEEAVSGSFRFGASFLVASCYHVALTGLLSSCPTLLMTEDGSDRQEAAGLADVFKTQRFAMVGTDDDAGATAGALLDEATSRPPGNGSCAMWLGQADKALHLARVCLDMERAAARNRLALTASAFREVAADLGELRKRRILEEKLAREAAEQTAVTISIPSPDGLAKYLAKSYWSRRRSGWVRSIKKRVNKWS